jgi:RimJ/RimL family protein N-acetyltransferase
VVAAVAAMILRTARLSLHELTADDAPFILTLLNDPAWLQFIGDRRVRTIEDAVAYIERGPRASYALHGFGLYLVTLTDSGLPMGICGLLKRDSLPEPDLGFAFLPAYRAQGYGFEAASAVRDFARDNLKLPRLLAIVSPTNASSIRLLERLGFVFERMMTVPGDGHEVTVCAARL